MLSARLKVISAATMLVPAEYYSMEESAVQTNPEFALPDEILSLESWVYRFPGILPFGCMLHLEHSFFSQYEVTPEQKQEILDYLDANFAELKALRPATSSASKDTFLQNQVKKQVWINRIYGDADIFDKSEDNWGGRRVAILKNQEWIGAFNYVGLSSANFGYLYRGYAFREGFGTVKRKIRNLQIVDNRDKLYPEYPEPNPQNEESEKLETDSEEEDFST